MYIALTPLSAQCTHTALYTTFSFLQDPGTCAQGMHSVLLHFCLRHQVLLQSASAKVVRLSGRRGALKIVDIIERARHGQELFLSAEGDSIVTSTGKI